MPKVTFVGYHGNVQQVDVPSGTSLMRAATDNGVPGVDGDCGGECACGTCHVYVDAAWTERTGNRNAAESNMLEFVDDLRENSRLACQIILTDELEGLIVSLPEGQH